MRNFNFRKDILKKFFHCLLIIFDFHEERKTVSGYHADTPITIKAEAIP